MTIFIYKGFCSGILQQIVPTNVTDQYDTFVTIHFRYILDAEIHFFRENHNDGDYIGFIPIPSALKLTLNCTLKCNMVGSSSVHLLAPSRSILQVDQRLIGYGLWGLVA